MWCATRSLWLTAAPLDIDDDGLTLLSEDRSLLLRRVPMRMVARAWPVWGDVMFQWDLGAGLQQDGFRAKHQATPLVTDLGAIWRASAAAAQQQQQPRASAAAPK